MIGGRAGATHFRRADGAPIEAAPRLRPDDAPDPPRSLARFAPESPPPWGKGESMDLDLAVFVIAERLEHRRAEQGANPQREGGFDSGLPPPMAA